MTDLDVVSGAIAARLRALPDVERLYPPRRSPLPGVLGTAVGVLSALASDDSVSVRNADDVTEVEVSLALRPGAAAPDAARLAAEAVHAALDGAGVGARRVVVRVSSVGT